MANKEKKCACRVKKVADGSCFPVIFAYIWPQITNKKIQLWMQLIWN